MQDLRRSSCAVVAATRGTVFHGKRHDEKTILECIAMLCERNSLAAIGRVKGLKDETVSAWLKQVAPQMQQLEEILLWDYELSRAQPRRAVDLRWPQGRKRGRPEEPERGTFWRGTALNYQTRLRVGRALAKTEEEVAQSLRAQLKERGHPAAPPPMATQGKGAYREALVETWGQVPPAKGRGRPPEHKQPQAGWHYLPVIKHRAGGHVIKVEVEVIYGDATTIELVGGHTAYVERTNLTSRHINGRLVRKTLSFSKKKKLLEAASVLEDAAYKRTRPVKTLRLEVNKDRRRFKKRSPAMAAELADHVWTIKELLMTVAPPD